MKKYQGAIYTDQLGQDCITLSNPIPKDSQIIEIILPDGFEVKDNYGASLDGLKRYILHTESKKVCQIERKGESFYLRSLFDTLAKVEVIY